VNEAQSLMQLRVGFAHEVETSFSIKPWTTDIA